MEAFDIFIQAGQSNAEGFGHGPADEVIPKDERVMYLTAPRVPSQVAHIFADCPPVLSVADDNVILDIARSNFSQSFAADYIKAGLLEEGRKVLIIRSAVGSSGFIQGHWGLNDVLYLKMLELCDYALALNPENRIKGLLWHQGEQETHGGNPPENYRKQLRAMVDGVREHLKQPDLPFVSGEFCRDWADKNREICQPLLKVIQEVTEEVGGIYITSDGLESNSQRTGNKDDIHFSRQGQYDLGHRYFKAYQKITNQ